jgi:hypothetical protein
MEIVTAAAPQIAAVPFVLKRRAVGVGEPPMGRVPLLGRVADKTNRITVYRQKLAEIGAVRRMTSAARYLDIPLT